MVAVGDLVYVVSSKQLQPLPNSTKGIVFSQIDDDWFRVYISWGDSTRVRDFPRWMLQKVEKR
jgi:hypothetical protein